MTRLDFAPVMIKAFFCLLASSAVSKGMFIYNNTDKETYKPPPLGSRDRPVPPDSLDGSGFAPLPDDNLIPQFDQTKMDGSVPHIRGFLTPYDITLPPDNYPGPVPPNIPGGLPNSRGFGAPDLSYCNMILEAPVPPTADQVPWFCTCSLCNTASTGQKGDRGDRGLPGYPGSPGSRGLTGFRGPPGFTGPPGFKGQKGDEGMKGNDGPVGPMGRQGERGFKGDKGDMGIDGSPGEQGPAGPPGDCSPLCSSVSGPPGEVGLPGIVGPRGLPGIVGETGAKGEKGDKGELGKTGAPGLTGLKGDQGVQGVCNCKDGEKGANGMIGPAGPKGDKGDVGPRGLEGVSGPKGNKGELGMAGFPGPCSPAIQSGFSARLAISYPSPDAPVPFSLIIYNVQFHYDPTTGIYRAPVNGTYIFSYNLCALNKVLKVGLFHNFAPIVKSTGPINLGMVSQEVILHLNTGDQVWIQVKDTNSNGMCVNSESSSTFSGALLYPDNCDAPFSRDLPEVITGTYTWGPVEATEKP